MIGKRGGPCLHASRIGQSGTTRAISLFINIPAVGEAGDTHRLAVVIDDVDDSVVADADTPEILVTRSFLQPDGLGLVARPSILDTRRVRSLSLRSSSSFRAEGLISMA